MKIKFTPGDRAEAVQVAALKVAKTRRIAEAEARLAHTTKVRFKTAKKNWKLARKTAKRSAKRLKQAEKNLAALEKYLKRAKTKLAAGSAMNKTRSKPAPAKETARRKRRSVLPPTPRNPTSDATAATTSSAATGTV